MPLFREAGLVEDPWQKLADWYRRGLAALVAMVGATFASRAAGFVWVVI